MSGKMADPKYADLPGIAHDEPDIYETTDLPESEQTDSFYEPENEVVEKIAVSSEEAYNKFKGKFLNAANVDFSDRLGKRIGAGYDARSGNWELAGQGERETPIQKYNRLQCEMKELLEELNNLDKSNGEKNSQLSTEKIEDSLKLLADLKLAETFGEELIGKIADPDGFQIKKLASQLEQFKQNINEKPESQSVPPGDAIVYQFNYRPEQTKLQQTSRLADLESRLHRLESVLGASSDKLSRLSAATGCESLLETAQHLCAKTSLLDSAQLNHIEGRIRGLSQMLESISQKKKELQRNEGDDQMILELFELVKNSESITKLLPQTIERLKALEAMHNKASEFTKTLTQVQLAQSEIEANVHRNKELLQGVQGSFAMNLNEINQTVVSLDNRIKALKNK